MSKSCSSSSSGEAVVIWSFGPWVLLRPPTSTASAAAESSSTLLSSETRQQQLPTLDTVIQLLTETAGKIASAASTAEQGDVVYSSVLMKLEGQLPQPPTKLQEEEGRQRRRRYKISISSSSNEGETMMMMTLDLEVRPAVCVLGPFRLYEPVSNKCLECLRSLAQFYSVPENVREVLLPITENSSSSSSSNSAGGGSVVSSRMLEFFCVTYTKQTPVVYQHVPFGGAAAAAAAGSSSKKRREVVVDVHTDYNSYLKVWKRECFDFFQRYTRVHLLLLLADSSQPPMLIKTTTGQLHGMYWAHVYGVYAYVQAHRAEIQRRMTAVHSANRQELRMFKQQGVKRKRKFLSDPAQKQQQPDSSAAAAVLASLPSGMGSNSSISKSRRLFYGRQKIYFDLGSSSSSGGDGDEN